MPSVGAGRARLVFFLAAIAWLALGSAAHACDEVVAGTGFGAVCAPDDEERCVAYSDADPDGVLGIWQHFERDGASPPGGVASCALAWVALDARAGPDLRISLAAQRVEVTRADTVVTAPGDTRGVITAWASPVSPPSTVDLTACDSTQPFLENASTNTLADRADEGTTALTDIRVELEPEVADDDGDGMVRVYVGVLGTATHDAIGTLDLRVEAEVVMDPCPIPVESVSIETDPQTVVPPPSPSTTTTTTAAAAPPADRLPVLPLASADENRPADERVDRAVGEAVAAPSRSARPIAMSEAQAAGDDVLPLAAIAAALCGAVLLTLVARRRGATAVADAAVAAPPPGSAAATPRSIGSRLESMGKTATTVIGLVTGLAVVLFLFRPNLEPTTANSVAIDEIAVETGVSLGEYVDHPAVAEVLTSAGTRDEVLALNEPIVDDQGVVVHFTFHSEGYVSKRVVTRWTLFDVETGRRVLESEGADPLPFSFRSEKRDADIGSWETWVRTGERSGRVLMVRMELYDESKGLRLAFRDSPEFVAP